MMNLVPFTSSIPRGLGGRTKSIHIFAYGFVFLMTTASNQELYIRTKEYH